MRAPTRSVVRVAGGVFSTAGGPRREGSRGAGQDIVTLHPREGRPFLLRDGDGIAVGKLGAG